MTKHQIQKAAVSGSYSPPLLGVSCLNSKVSRPETTFYGYADDYGYYKVKDDLSGISENEDAGGIVASARSPLLDVAVPRLNKVAGSIPLSAWHRTLLLRNSRKTECGAKRFLACFVVCAAPFALLRKNIINPRMKECITLICIALLLTVDLSLVGAAANTDFGLRCGRLMTITRMPRRLWMP